MPRERPVHNPRPIEGPDEDEDDLGIYEDDGQSSVSSNDLLDNAQNRHSPNQVADVTNDEPVHDAKLDLPPMETENPDLNTNRSLTDDETDRGVRRVEIASTPKATTPVTTTPQGVRDEGHFDLDLPERLISAGTALTQETLRLHSENRSIPPRNTPATDGEIDELRNLESRLTGSDSRRACYERAVSLLKTRCSSQLLLPTRDQVMPAAGRCLSSGPNSEFFYIRQDKPLPMPPLKVWRGFHGNVYFEPINVSRTAVTSPPPTSRGLLTARKQRQKQKPPMNQTARNERAFRQMAILDREHVQRSSNAFLTEDLTWVHGQASTGSLRTQKEYSRSKVPYNREKIIKGSVAKTLVSSFNRLTPLKVSGGGCNSPTKAPPLIQGQTQYTNSDKRRMLTDSAEPEYMSIENPDTKALVHILPARGTPTLVAPVSSPL